MTQTLMSNLRKNKKLKGKTLLNNAITTKEICSLPSLISSSYLPTLSGAGQFLSSSLYF
jgi:hypothetical protein